MPLTQDCLTLLVDLTTGHYNRGTHSTSLWLAFLTNVQQSRTLELCVQNATMNIDDVVLCIPLPSPLPVPYSKLCVLAFPLQAYGDELTDH